MAKLYELTEQYTRLLDKDEFTQEDEALLDLLSDSVKDKCVSIAKHIKNLKMEHNAILEEMENMSNRAEKIQRNIDSMSEYMIINMKKLDIEKLKTPNFDILLSKNAESVRIIDEHSIPKKFIRELTKITESFDKIAIKEAIQNGEEVPGAELKRKLKLTIK